MEDGTRPETPFFPALSTGSEVAMVHLDTEEPKSILILSPGWEKRQAKKHYFRLNMALEINPFVFQIQKLRPR